MGPIDLLKAEHVGVRELKANLSRYMSKPRLVIATDHGQPKKVLVTYKDMVALIELLRDLADQSMSGAFRAGRQSIKSGTAGIPARSSLEKLR